MRCQDEVQTGEVGIMRGKPMDLRPRELLCETAAHEVKVERLSDAVEANRVLGVRAITLLRPAYNPERYARARREGDRGELLLRSQRASRCIGPFRGD